MTDTAEDHRRDLRLRAAVKRQGYMLRRSTSRDPRVAGHGRYYIIDPRTGSVVRPTAYEGVPQLTLDDVERWLADPGVTT